MIKLNPYEDFLDGRPVDAILAATPEAIRSMLATIGDANTSTRPEPGKWSAAEIVCHLADCELVFGFRMRQTLAEDASTIQPFDQDKWATQYAGIPAASGTRCFFRVTGLEFAAHSVRASRHANRTTTHPVRGVLTFRTIVETMAGHDLNHLGQLRRIAASGVRAAAFLGSMRRARHGIKMARAAASSSSAERTIRSYRR